MILIKTLTKQEYENTAKSPSEFCFYENEKDICQIITYQLAKNIKENREILKMFLPFKKPEVYEITKAKKTLYLIFHKEQINPVSLNQNLV